MKTTLLSLFLGFTLTLNANALDLNKLKTAQHNGSKQNIVSVSDLGKSTSDKITKMAEEKVNQAVGRVEEKINNQIEEYKEKANEQIARVEKMVSKAEEQLNFIEKLKAKAMGYVKMGVIAGVILLIGLLVVIFIMWRIWKTVKRIGSLNFIINYKEYEDKLRRLEDEVSDLKREVSKIEAEEK